MYEKYFRSFLAFLFPNDLFPDDSILFFVLLCVKDEVTKEDLDEYQRVCWVELDKESIEVIHLLARILKEMRKSEEEKPEKELIDSCLGRIMQILETWTSKNLENYKSLEDFLHDKGLKL